MNHHILDNLITQFRADKHIGYLVYQIHVLQIFQSLPKDKRKLSVITPSMYSIIHYCFMTFCNPFSKYFHTLAVVKIQHSKG